MTKFERAYGAYDGLIPDFRGFLEAVAGRPPLHVRVNTLKARTPEVVESLAAHGIVAAPEPWCEFLLRVGERGATAAGTTLLHALGQIYLQSASSAVSALAVGARPADRVLDLCAAPGSKTTLMAQQMGDAGCLVANEPSQKRLMSLAMNLDRMGLTSVLVTAYSGQSFPRKHSFDRVLVDAPCSGEGTWRGPDARPQTVKPDFRAYLVRQQKALLARGYEVLKPGGTLVYSTCTYSPDENEAVVGPFVAESGATVLPLGLEIPGEPGLTAWRGQTFSPQLALARRLYPHRFDSEGFFVVRLAKP